MRKAEYIPERWRESTRQTRLNRVCRCGCGLTRRACIQAGAKRRVEEAAELRARVARALDIAIEQDRVIPFVVWLQEDCQRINIAEEVMRERRQDQRVVALSGEIGRLAAYGDQPPEGAKVDVLRADDALLVTRVQGEIVTHMGHGHAAWVRFADGDVSAVATVAIRARDAATLLGELAP